MRNRFLAIFLVPLLCLPLTVLAAENDGGFWEKMKNKLTQIAPQKKGAATTAVGGTRAAKDQTADNLYWKDEEKKLQVSEEEYGRFMAAYQAAVAGERGTAKQGFETFLKDYPQSVLGEDAQAALLQLK